MKHEPMSLSSSAHLLATRGTGAGLSSPVNCTSERGIAARKRGMIVSAVTQDADEKRAWLGGTAAAQQQQQHSSHS